MIPNFIDRNKLPHKPGVYIYKDVAGNILYVGKAIDLYHRVASYFSGRNLSPRTDVLVSYIKEVDTIIVESELEALILEANLIKKHLPPYNIKLTDDKDYLYIKVTKDIYPKITTARKQELTDAKDFFGPFPSSRTVKETLRKLRRIFPWCANPPRENSKTVSKPCFYYHLGLCSGPCAGVISKSDYQKNIKNFIRFMRGEKDALTADLTLQMSEYSANQQFEQASTVKKMINGLTYLLQPNRAKIYLENPNFLEDQRALALIALQKDLELSKVPERIECYDISNIQGHQAVASLVVLTDGEVDKKWYRKFKMSQQGKPNDFAMIAEVISRRLKHKEWPLPDLFLIDGGRGQVRAAFEQLQVQDINIPVFGLAKRMEWLYSPDEDIVKLPKSSPSLHLLQKIRDEAHRFAITYHRKLRNRQLST